MTVYVHVICQFEEQNLAGFYFFLGLTYIYFPFTYLGGSKQFAYCLPECQAFRPGPASPKIKKTVVPVLHCATQGSRGEGGGGSAAQTRPSAHGVEKASPLTLTFGSGYADFEF